MNNPEKQINDWIKNNKVFVASKSYCPFCARTKALLEKLQIDAFIVELDTREDGAALQDALEYLSGQRTVPNIYIDGKHIGGNSELQDLKSSGELDSLADRLDLRARD